VIVTALQNVEQKHAYDVRKRHVPQSRHIKAGGAGTAWRQNRQTG
jgi:hypothetical protein